MFRHTRACIRNRKKRTPLPTCVRYHASTSVSHTCSLSALLNRSLTSYPSYTPGPAAAANHLKPGTVRSILPSPSSSSSLANSAPPSSPPLSLQRQIQAAANSMNTRTHFVVARSQTGEAGASGVRGSSTFGIGKSIFPQGPAATSSTVVSLEQLNSSYYASGAQDKAGRSSNTKRTIIRMTTHAPSANTRDQPPHLRTGPTRQPDLPSTDIHLPPASHNFVGETTQDRRSKLQSKLADLKGSLQDEKSAAPSASALHIPSTGAELTPAPIPLASPAIPHSSSWDFITLNSMSPIANAGHTHSITRQRKSESPVNSRKKKKTPSDKSPRKQCAHPACSKRGSSVCGQCMQTYYCSRECQLDHWNQHRGSCRPTSQRTPKKTKSTVKVWL